MNSFLLNFYLDAYFIVDKIKLKTPLLSHPSHTVLHSLDMGENISNIYLKTPPISTSDYSRIMKTDWIHLLQIATPHPPLMFNGRGFILVEYSHTWQGLIPLSVSVLVRYRVGVCRTSGGHRRCPPDIRQTSDRCQPFALSVQHDQSFNRGCAVDLVSRHRFTYLGWHLSQCLITLGSGFSWW